MDASNDSRGPERGSGELEPPRRPARESVRARFNEFGVFGPMAVVLLGVGLDRAGYSALGITLTFVGGVAFIVMLYVLARWG